MTMAELFWLLGANGTQTIPQALATLTGLAAVLHKRQDWLALLRWFQLVCCCQNSVFIKSWIEITDLIVSENKNRQWLLPQTKDDFLFCPFTFPVSFQLDSTGKVDNSLQPTRPAITATHFTSAQLRQCITYNICCCENYLMDFQLNPFAI